jgi:hypothetical protein
VLAVSHFSLFIVSVNTKKKTDYGETDFSSAVEQDMMGVNTTAEAFRKKQIDHGRASVKYKHSMFRGGAQPDFRPKEEIMAEKIEEHGRLMRNPSYIQRMAKKVTAPPIVPGAVQLERLSTIHGTATANAGANAHASRKGGGHRMRPSKIAVQRSSIKPLSNPTATGN